MIFNHRYFHLSTLIFVLIFVSLSTATSFCNELTSTDDKDTPCFLELSEHYPAHLQSSGNSLVLPCHVARSKQSTIEWWYQDFQKLVNIKIYPVLATVRPTVLRFITSTSPTSAYLNETDIIDVSVLLRHVNVDDSGIYRCVIRPWTPTRVNNIEDNLSEEDSSVPSLTYHVKLTGSRLCQGSSGWLPCFSNMRTSSPTFVDAYETTFLQCVIHNRNRPVNVFWVVGNASENSVLITDYLTNNQHNGDRLRRVFPLSPFDHSIELTINRDIRERTYSCVIDGASDAEGTLFTYIVRSIDLVPVTDKTIKSGKNHTIVLPESQEETTAAAAATTTTITTTTMGNEKIIAHDALTPEQIEELKQKNTQEHKQTKGEKVHHADNNEDLLEFFEREETSTTR